jgi:hypothetical protein
MFLQVAAFLLPVYFVFYPALNENPNDPFIKSLWRFTICGFCFYGIAALIIFVL